MLNFQNKVWWTASHYSFWYYNYGNVDSIPLKLCFSHSQNPVRWNSQISRTSHIWKNQNISGVPATTIWIFNHIALVVFSKRSLSFANFLLKMSIILPKGQSSIKDELRQWNLFGNKTDTPNWTGKFWFKWLQGCNYIREGRELEETHLPNNKFVKPVDLALNSWKNFLILEYLAVDVRPYSRHN